MKKYEIVKEHKEFEDILHTGKYIKAKNFVIYNKENKYNYPRFGIAVGKKIGNAVTRNKLKRQFRMIITNNKKIFQNGRDYIIIVKRNALETKFCDLVDEIINIMYKG